ncbi:unnamed protein product [Rhizophagus irregularis]|nr:unnamed protein product [Rhizophagus irregularis]
MTTNFQIINMYFLKIITKLIYYIKYGPSKVKIFRTSDYDLNKDERKEKYENYYILCEKCIQEINKRDYNCKDCYNKETDPNEKIRMRLGSSEGGENFLNEIKVLIKASYPGIVKCFGITQEPISLNYALQVEEQKNPSSNFDETINITLNLSNTIKTHSQPIYTSKILELPSYLPEPTNCPNQQEFVSSRIAQTVQSEKFNDPQSECLECIIKDR